MRNVLVAALTAVVLVLAGGRARADEWTALDTGLEVAFAGAQFGDYLQTRQIVADGKESNPIMGETGDVVHPMAYFAVLTAAHVVVARVLPNPYRRIFQGVTIGVELDVMHTNYQAGYGFSF